MNSEIQAFSFATPIVVGVFLLLLVSPLLLLWFFKRKRKQLVEKKINDRSLNIILLFSFAGWILEFARKRKLILESADPIFSATAVFFVIFLSGYFTLHFYRKLRKIKD